MRTTQLVGHSDPDVVRPGTSAALTARTIDATVHPVTQARDAVAEVPRLVDSVPPQLLGGTIALTGLVLMLALQRFRLSLSPVLLAGLLMTPVSNYRATQQTAKSKAVEAALVEKREPSEVPDWYDRSPRVEEPVSRSEEPRSFGDFSFPSVEIDIPPDLIEEALPLIELVVPEDWNREDVSRFLHRNSERLRREIRRLRLQQRLEARRHAYSMEHHHHSR